MVPWSESLGESYAHSAVWLASALALFVAGIRLARQYIRCRTWRHGAGGAKVFLSDMSISRVSTASLLYRPRPRLVGIGWLYARYVQKAAQAA
jgi:uncharacterized membrane protein